MQMQAPQAAPAAAEMLKPTLPAGILPVYLAKLYPQAADAALKAGEMAGGDRGGLTGRRRQCQHAARAAAAERRARLKPCRGRRRR